MLRVIEKLHIKLVMLLVRSVPAFSHTFGELNKKQCKSRVQTNPHFSESQVETLYNRHPAMAICTVRCICDLFLLPARGISHSSLGIFWVSTAVSFLLSLFSFPFRLLTVCLSLAMFNSYSLPPLFPCYGYMCVICFPVIMSVCVYVCVEREAKRKVKIKRVKVAKANWEEKGEWSE